jgi:sugar phosphate isomerase/epimerase
MDRRKFLGASTLLLPGMALAGHSAPEPGSRGRLKLGTVTYNLGRAWDIETLINNCTEAGFEGAELRTTHAHGVEIDLPPARRTEVRRRFEDSPVKLVGLGSACEYHSPDPAELKRNIEETKAFVRLAADVGAEGVKVRPDGLPEGVPEEKTLEQIGRALRDCSAFAQDYGVRIWLEVHGRETSRFPRIKRIMEHADHPNFWICWNSNPQDLLDDGIEANLEMVRTRLGHVHMRDLFVDYPFRTLLGFLIKNDYQGFCMAEIPESCEPVRVMRYFRALFEAYGEMGEVSL